ncbi:MAG: hypothetical protein IJP62_08190 [Treponema sp.]|nr:hypothetical protein [Treponema sp.]
MPNDFLHLSGGPPQVSSPPAGSGFSGFRCRFILPFATLIPERLRRPYNPYRKGKYSHRKNFMV